MESDWRKALTKKIDDEDERLKVQRANQTQRLDEQIAFMKGRFIPIVQEFAEMLRRKGRTVEVIFDQTKPFAVTTKVRHDKHLEMHVRFDVDFKKSTLSCVHDHYPSCTSYPRGTLDRWSGYRCDLTDECIGEFLYSQWKAYAGAHKLRNSD